MLDFLWHSAWIWFGAGGIAVIALVAVAYFIPGFRLTALEIIGGILAAGSIYAKGNRDEARKWNDAIKTDVDKGNKARADAERSVNDGSVRGDEWNRDKSGL